MEEILSHIEDVVGVEEGVAIKNGVAEDNKEGVGGRSQRFDIKK